MIVNPVLGIEIIPEYEFWAGEAGGPLMISSDSTKLALFEGEPPHGKPTAGFHRVAFRVGAKGFHQFIQRMTQFDLRDNDDYPVRRDSVVDHVKSFSIYFCDPYGHRLEITTYESKEAARHL